MKIGDTQEFRIYGHLVDCEILEIRESEGTIDVQRLSDGNCFRISGLAFQRSAPKMKLLGAQDEGFMPGVVIQ